MPTPLDRARPDGYSSRLSAGGPIPVWARGNRDRRSRLLASWGRAIKRLSLCFARATGGMLWAWIRLSVTQVGGLPMDRDALMNQMKERFEGTGKGTRIEWHCHCI